METDFGNKSRDGIKMEFERKSNDVVHVDNNDCDTESVSLNESILNLNMAFQANDDISLNNNSSRMYN